MLKTSVFGYDLHVFPDLPSLTRQVVAHPGVYISLGAEGLMRPEPEFREVVNRHVGYADGVGAVLAAKLLNRTSLTKIPGCELWLSVLRALPTARVAIWGASPEVLMQVRQKLALECPALQLVYAENGYTTDPQRARSAIVQACPDVVILALGQPRQELLADQLASALPRARFLPVGGSLDVYVGKVQRAPAVMIRLHLEWAYRLWLEPSRIKRQLVLPRFLWQVLKARAAAMLRLS